jgi:hypothetical protein
MALFTPHRRWRYFTGVAGAGLLLTLGMSPDPALAQSPEICASNRAAESPADTLRTVMLPDFNLSVDIPSNYRAIKLQDGSVEILHPADFEILQCVLRGGEAGHGYYSEIIRLVEPDPSLTLREQAIWSVGYQLDSEGDRAPAYAQLLPYEGAGGINGYLVESISGYSVTFLGYYNGSDQLLEVNAGCDCGVGTEAVQTVLRRITVFNQP